MGTCVPEDDPVAVEHSPAITFFVNGFHRIAHVGGGNILFCFYRKDVCTDGHGEIERVVEVKIQIHCTDLPACIAQATAALAREGVCYISNGSALLM